MSAAEFTPTLHPVVIDTEPIVTTIKPVNRSPKLTLPIFSGDHLAWQTFHDSVKAAVHNTALKSLITYAHNCMVTPQETLLDSL